MTHIPTKKTLLSLLFTLCMTQVTAYSLSLNQLTGAWKTERERDGYRFTQEIEFKEDVVWVTVRNGETGEIGFIARGVAKLSMFEGLDILTISDLSAGQSKTTLEPIEEDFVYSMPIRIGYKKIYLAAEFQAEREEAPELNVYEKVDKPEE